MHVCDATMSLRAVLFRFLLVLTALAHHLLAQLAYSFGGSFANLGRAFSGANSDVLASAAGALAEIDAGLGRMQCSEIASGSCSAFAQVLRPLASAFANVLATLADFLARAGLRVLLLVLLHRLLLGRSLILGRIRGACKCGQTQKKQGARRD